MDAARHLARRGGPRRYVKRRRYPGIHAVGWVPFDRRWGTMDQEEHYFKMEIYELVRRDPAIFEFLQSGSLDGIWSWDIERQDQEWMSPRFKELFGYRDDEIPNTAAWWQANIFPEDLAVVLDNFTKHLTDPAIRMTRSCDTAIETAGRSGCAAADWRSETSGGRRGPPAFAPAGADRPGCDAAGRGRRHRHRRGAPQTTGHLRRVRAGRRLDHTPHSTQADAASS